MGFTFELLDDKRNIVDRVELEEYDAQAALEYFEQEGHRGSFLLQRAGSRPEAAAFIGIVEL